MRRSQISSNGANDAFERTRGSVLGVRLALCFARDRWRVAQRERWAAWTSAFRRFEVLHWLGHVG